MLFCTNSIGPFLQSLESIKASDAAASINTHPGSSHKKDKINKSEFFKYLKTFSLNPTKKICFDKLFFLLIFLKKSFPHLHQQ